MEEFGMTTSREWRRDRRGQAAGKDVESLAKDSGQARLEALCHKQELQRKFGLVASVSVSFAVMSYMLGITGRALVTSFDHTHNMHASLRHTRPRDPSRIV